MFLTSFSFLSTPSSLQSLMTLSLNILLSLISLIIFQFFSLIIFQYSFTSISLNIVFSLSISIFSSLNLTLHSLYISLHSFLSFLTTHHSFSQLGQLHHVSSITSSTLAFFTGGTSSPLVTVSFFPFLLFFFKPFTLRACNWVKSCVFM